MTEIKILMESICLQYGINHGINHGIVLQILFSDRMGDCSLSARECQSGSRCRSLGPIVLELGSVLFDALHASSSASMSLVRRPLPRSADPCSSQRS